MMTLTFRHGPYLGNSRDNWRRAALPLPLAGTTGAVN